MQEEMSITEDIHSICGNPIHVACVVQNCEEPATQHMPLKTMDLMFCIEHAIKISKEIDRHD